jgi:hypothetical protein
MEATGFIEAGASAACPTGAAGAAASLTGLGAAAAGLSGLGTSGACFSGADAAATCLTKLGASAAGFTEPGACATGFAGANAVAACLTGFGATATGFTGRGAGCAGMTGSDSHPHRTAATDAAHSSSLTDFIFLKIFPKPDRAGTPRDGSGRAQPAIAGGRMPARAIGNPAGNPGPKITSTPFLP